MSSSGDGVRRVPLLNLANGLTAVRIIVVPIFVCFAVISGMEDRQWRIAACGMFCLASATDYADGWIARNWDLVTSFGKIADPIADKALIGSGLILLSSYGRIPVWVTVVILVREIGVTALRFWVIRRAVIAASRGGKIKTALQVMAIALCLAPLPEGVERLGWWLMMAAMVVTVGTGLDYLARALRLHAMPQTSSLPIAADRVVPGPATVTTEEAV